MTERQNTGTFPADPQAADSTPLSAANTSTPGRGPEPTDEPLPRAFGRYELRRLLGKGGMGRVYLAHDPQLDRLVALKMPTPVAVAGWRERFLAEARAAATLTHPNVCPVHDVGELDGQPFLTMAYLEGETLAAKLAREAPLDPAEAVELLGTIARAMFVAHKKGIVHRDLKPSNLMIAPDGRPVVMDFGLAIRSTAADDIRLTLTGVALGTPAYMPPEQASGEPDAIGPPSDVYSLGVILYEMVTGRVPFKAKSFGKLLAQIERDAPPPPSSINPNVAPALEAIILTALAKSPADRFATAGELADALDRYQEGDHAAVTARYRRPYTVPDATGEYLPDAAFLSTAPPPKKPSRRRWWLAGAAALLLAATAGAVIFVQTDYGQLVVQLSDPDAKVDVRVNGQEVTLDPGGGKAVRVKAKAGHKLEVTGADFETVAESFDVKRGGVTLARVTLVPKGKAGVPPAVGKPSDPPGKDPVAVEPAKTEPPKPVSFPEQPTLVEAGGHQILADATKEQMQAWLDDRKKAGHSVTWLDVTPVDGKPVYSAVAALDDRETKWVAMLDHPAEDVSISDRLDKYFDTHAHRIISLSGFTRGEGVRSALLAHPGWKRWGIAADMMEDTTRREFDRATKSGFSTRVIRPIPVSEGGAVYAYFGYPGNRSTGVISVPDAQLRTYLQDQRTTGNLPLMISAYPSNGVPLFTAVSTPNADKWEWQTDTGLTAAELKSKAAEFAAKGFRPACVTAYPWDGAVRYCVVWVKEPPRPVAPPKEKTLIEVPGWQILADASREQVEVWLADRKRAGHSVMWLDAYAVEGKPVFSAVAALDDREPMWTAWLDEPIADVRTLTSLRKKLNTESNWVVSLATYLRDEEDLRVAMLWHHGGKSWGLGPNELESRIETAIPQEQAEGYPVRLLRPFAVGEPRPRYAYYSEAVLRGTAACKYGATAAQLAAFLDEQRRNNFLPRSLAAVAHNGAVEFTTVCEPNRQKWDWQADTGLTAAELKSKSAEFAGKGFRPSCVTAYAWDGAVRYCVVWVKDLSKAKEPAATPELPLAPEPRAKP